MKKPVKITLLILSVILAFIIAFVLFLSIQMKIMKDKIAAIKIENIDIKNLKSGEYYGECKIFVVTAEVKVIINDGKISKIEIIKHEHGPGYGADKLADTIIDKQTLDVDAVSGATGSSKVLKKAIESALKKAK